MTDKIGQIKAMSLDDIIDNVHQIAPIVSNNENATVIHFLIQFAIL